MARTSADACSHQCRAGPAAQGDEDTHVAAWNNADIPKPKRTRRKRAPRTGSGLEVALLFQRLLALTFLVAWLSLGTQVLLLVGSRGLLPAAPFVERLRASAVGFGQFPSFLLYGASDTALRVGIWAGAALSILALIGIRPRLCFALATLLYLGYTLVCRSFLAFQWDNLLLECGALAVFLPAGRRARFAHVLFRILVFKLYFESGIAKWQSHLGDWQDGSAMTYYYETAPLPTALAWYAHALPDAWHHFESRVTLVLELLVPFAIFAPRPARLAAALVLSGFQIVNIVTANYGFFAYLALALHVFLLDDADVVRGYAWLAERVRRLRARLVARGLLAARRLQARLRLLRRVFNDARTKLNAMPRLRALRQARKPLATSIAVAVSFVYVSASLSLGLQRFWRAAPQIALFDALERLVAPFRVINVYHLFGHITRERYEAEFQTSDGMRFVAHDLRYKPGDPLRAPPFVAPHQPRVDFLLWFYGLGVRRRAERAFPPAPADYVSGLLERLCNDPGAVAPLFAGALPERPNAVRIVFWEYEFTSLEQRKASGAYWKRNEITATRAFECGRR